MYSSKSRAKSKAASSNSLNYKSKLFLIFINLNYPRTHPYRRKGTRKGKEAPKLTGDNYSQFRRAGTQILAEELSEVDSASE